MCAYTYIKIYVTTIKEQEAMKLRKSNGGGYMGKFRGRKGGEGNDVVLQSQK